MSIMEGGNEPRTHAMTVDKGRLSIPQTEADVPARQQRPETAIAFAMLQLPAVLIGPPEEAGHIIPIITQREDYFSEREWNDDWEDSDRGDSYPRLLTPFDE